MTRVKFAGRARQRTRQLQSSTSDRRSPSHEHPCFPGLAAPCYSTVVLHGPDGTNTCSYTIRMDACGQRRVARRARRAMDETLATLHPDCLFEDQPLAWTLRGREGARQHYEFWWSTLGAHLEAGQLHWPRADLAIGEAAFAGRHVGEFFDVPPTGAAIYLPFVVVVSFRDGPLAGEADRWPESGSRTTSHRYSDRSDRTCSTRPQHGRHELRRCRAHSPR